MLYSKTTRKIKILAQHFRCDACNLPAYFLNGCVAEITPDPLPHRRHPV